MLFNSDTVIQWQLPFLSEINFFGFLLSSLMLINLIDFFILVDKSGKIVLSLDASR